MLPYHVTILKTCNMPINNNKSTKCTVLTEFTLSDFSKLVYQLALELSYLNKFFIHKCKRQLTTLTS